MTEEFKIPSVETPCVSNCCLDTEDICLGCHRSLDEITSWLTVDEETRQQYLKNIAARKQRKEKSGKNPVN